MKSRRFARRVLSVSTCIAFLTYSFVLSAGSSPDKTRTRKGSQPVEVEILHESAGEGWYKATILFSGSDLDRRMYTTLDLERESALITFEAGGELFEVELTDTRENPVSRINYNGLVAFIDPADITGSIEASSFQDLRATFLKGDLAKRMMALTAYANDSTHPTASSGENRRAPEMQAGGFGAVPFASRARLFESGYLNDSRSPQDLVSSSKSHRMTESEGVSELGSVSGSGVVSGLGSMSGSQSMHNLGSIDVRGDIESLTNLNQQLLRIDLDNSSSFQWNINCVLSVLGFSLAIIGLLVGCPASAGVTCILAAVAFHVAIFSVVFSCLA